MLTAHDKSKLQFVFVSTGSIEFITLIAHSANWLLLGTLYLMQEVLASSDFAMTAVLFGKVLIFLTSS